MFLRNLYPIYITDRSTVTFNGNTSILSSNRSGIVIQRIPFYHSKVTPYFTITMVIMVVQSIHMMERYHLLEPLIIKLLMTLMVEHCLQ